MTHMVIFRTPEGKAGYHHADDLDAALRFVERLRNIEGVTDARVFQLHEVPIEFRQYYRVEVGGAAAGAATGGATEPPVEETAADGEAAGDAVDAAAPPRFGIFARG